MGVGAAFVMPATLSLITAVFPPEERRKAIAIWAGFAGAGGAFGPIVSGALLEWFWWGSTILVNLPIIALVAIARGHLRAPVARRRVPRRSTRWAPCCRWSVWPPSSTGSSKAPSKGWTSGVVVASFVTAVVVLTGFLVWERRTAHPMLPLAFFARPPVQRRQRASSPSPSSACSASSSCSASTCSSCGGTRRC